MEEKKNNRKGVKSHPNGVKSPKDLSKRNTIEEIMAKRGYRQIKLTDKWVKALHKIDSCTGKKVSANELEMVKKCIYWTYFIIFCPIEELDGMTALEYINKNRNFTPQQSALDFFQKFAEFIDNGCSCEHTKKFM